MARPPQVAGLVFCDRFDVDPLARQTSLLGLFQARTVTAFPAVLPQFSVYVALFGGSGEGTMELVGRRMETEADLYRDRRWIHLPGSGATLQLVLPVIGMAVPAAGRYSMILRFDGHDLTQRILDIFQS
jgi:Family of unknown function (DUF6941)